jgi:hypothetical protein
LALHGDQGLEVGLDKFPGQDFIKVEVDRAGLAGENVLSHRGLLPKRGYGECRGKNTLTPFVEKLQPFIVKSFNIFKKCTNFFQGMKINRLRNLKLPGFCLSS